MNQVRRELLRELQQPIISDTGSIILTIIGLILIYGIAKGWITV